jgi:hypothetical protein
MKAGEAKAGEAGDDEAEDDEAEDNEAEDDEAEDDEVKGDESSDRLPFHNAVMRWKCSLLTEEELRDMDEWIANSLSGKKEVFLKPWKATQGEEDELSTENEYIQRYALPSPQIVMRRANAGSQFY